MLKRIFAAVLTVAVIFSTVIGIDTTLGKYYGNTYSHSFYMGTVGSGGITFLAHNSLEEDVQGYNDGFGTWGWTKSNKNTESVTFVTKEDAEAAGTPEFYGACVYPGDNGSGGQSRLWYSFVEADGYTSKLNRDHKYYVCYDVYHEYSANDRSSLLSVSNAFHFDETISNKVSVLAPIAVAGVDGSRQTVGTWDKMSALFDGGAVPANNVTSGTNDAYSSKTVPADNADSIYFGPQAYSHGNGEHWLKNFIFIDLTENFGAGHEPSREWCDKYIKYRFAEEEQIKDDVVRPLMTLRMTDPESYRIIDDHRNTATQTHNYYKPFYSHYKIYFGATDLANGERGIGMIPPIDDILIDGLGVEYTPGVNLDAATIQSISDEYKIPFRNNETLTDTYHLKHYLGYNPTRVVAGLENEDHRDYGNFFLDNSTTAGHSTIVMFSKKSQPEMRNIDPEEIIDQETGLTRGLDAAKSQLDPTQLDPTHTYYYSFKYRSTRTITVRPGNTFHYVPVEYDANGDKMSGTGLFYHNSKTHEAELAQYLAASPDRYVTASGILPSELLWIPPFTEQSDEGNTLNFPGGYIDSVSIGIGSSQVGYGWIRDFVLVDLTEYFGDDPKNIPSKSFCDKYFTIDALENDSLSVASLRMMMPPREKNKIELEEGMIAGTQIDIVDMSTVKSSKNIAIDETPEGYEFYGWHIRSDFASMLLPLDEAELTLEDLYASVDGEPYPLTLTAIYKEKPPDPSPSPEPSIEPSVEVSEEPSTEPTAEGVIGGGGSDVSEETTPAPAPTETIEPTPSPTETTEPTVSPTPTETIEPAPEPSETPDNIINIDASEVENISIDGIDGTFVKGDPLALSFIPNDNYQLPDTIELVIDGEEYLVPTSGESGYDSIFFEDGILIISADFTADISDLVIKASGVSVSVDGGSSADSTEEPTTEPSEAPSEEPTPEPSDDPNEFSPSDELLGNDIVIESPEPIEPTEEPENGGISIEDGEVTTEGEPFEEVVQKEVLVTTIKKEEEDDSEPEEPTDDGGSDGGDGTDTGDVSFDETPSEIGGSDTEFSE